MQDSEFCLKCLGTKGNFKNQSTPKNSQVNLSFPGPGMNDSFSPGRGSQVCGVPTTALASENKTFGITFCSRSIR
jgi:hypothetical protein